MTWAEITVLSLVYVAGMVTCDLVIRAWEWLTTRRQRRDLSRPLSELWEPPSDRPIPDDVIVEDHRRSDR